MRDRTRLLGRLLRQTLVPPSRGGPATLRRLAALALFAPPFLALQLLHWLGFFLDDILFPGYRRVDVREPLFVVGMPRSGTTFLQRVLAEDEERFTTLRLWELLLAPSVTERKGWLALGSLDRRVGRPVGRLLDHAARRGFAFMEEVHAVDLRQPEEDYLLLLPAFACFLQVLAWPDHRELWRLTRFDGQDPTDRTRILAFYRSCLQRHLYVVGEEKRILSKNPSFTPMVRSLSEAFPGARFVCCVRDPREALPSLLSSLEEGARLFGWSPAEPRHRDRFVDMLRHFTEHALEELGGRDDAVFLPLHRLSDDVDGTVRDLYRTFGWRPGSGLEEALARRSAASRRHRSGHRYALSDYGLEAEGVERVFGALYRAFDFPDLRTSPPAPGSGPSPA